MTGLGLGLGRWSLAVFLFSFSFFRQGHRINKVNGLTTATNFSHFYTPALCLCLYVSVCLCVCMSDCDNTHTRTNINTPDRMASGLNCAMDYGLYRLATGSLYSQMLYKPHALAPPHKPPLIPPPPQLPPLLGSQQHRLAEGWIVGHGTRVVAYR